MNAYNKFMVWILRRHKLTEFEISVLCAAMDIKPGMTVTYSELAHRVGKPGASRAAGNALNRNPLPLLIPCHRVVASNGIGGYRYGITLKRMLLGIESLPLMGTYK